MIIIIRRPIADPFTTRQHIQALSQRNKAEYLERIGAATPIIEELVKVKPSTWTQVKGLFTSMEAVGRMGMLGNVGMRMQQAAMFPMNIMQNRIEFMLESLFMPLLPIVNRAVSAYESYVMKNQTGALIGGAIGMLVGLALPGGPMMWGLIGGGIGAGIEATKDYWTQVISGKPLGKSTPYDPLGAVEYTEDEEDLYPIVEDIVGGALQGTRKMRLEDGRVVRVRDV